MRDEAREVDKSAILKAFSTQKSLNFYLRAVENYNGF